MGFKAMKAHKAIAVILVAFCLGICNACFAQSNQCESEIRRVFSGFVFTLCDAIFDVSEIENSRTECRQGTLRTYTDEDLIANYCVPLGLSGDAVEPGSITCSQCEDIIESVLTCDNLGLVANQSISDCYDA